uniref:Uncharacterized protein n=2 Tax=Guillardia theta TaxID=55529 RepID=A0A7S4JBY5_GUITH|mmetsp:Transcript_15010/g.50719  ORF Transcript_15010/g.50719 Transcript_15010/m.50719 type:complete len:164 (+) Transcript_15010:453-944(+)
MKRTMRRISEYFEILNQVWEEIFQLRNLYQSNLSAVIQCPTEAEECLSIRMRWAFVEEEELPFSPSVWPTLLVHIPWHYPFRAPSWAFLGLYDHLPSTASFLSIFRELHCRYASMDHDQTLGGEDEGGNEPREEEGPLYGRGFAHLVQSWLEACLSFVDQNEL